VVNRRGRWLPKTGIKFRIVAALVVIVLALAADGWQAPEGQLTTRAALAGVHAYQAIVAPLYARMGVRCRFTPTCSHYGEVCIRQFGAVRGGWLAMKRVLRCGPWTPMGTADAPPTL
jgi:putative membrane protein insertion efficiency factor